MVKLFDFFEAVNRRVLILEKGLLVIILVIFVMVALGQAIARNFFDVASIFITELINISTLWIAFLGAAIATEYMRHIRIDLLSYAASKKGVQWLNSIMNCIIMLVCSWFFLAALKHNALQRQSDVSLVLTGVPDWCTSLILPYFFAITAFRALIQLKRNIRGEKLEEIEVKEVNDVVVEEASPATPESARS